MAPTPVVTCFLRYRDDVLIVRRSDAVGSYPGRWGAVSGHVARSGRDPDNPDREPLAAARAEIAEETGLLDDCELVRAGGPFEVAAPDHGDWRIHPFLFDCGSDAVALDEEATTAEWVPPTEIPRRETVPELWRSYDAVRPTVATVRADEEHGSAYLSLRALDVLRDRAGELALGAEADADGWTVLATLARELLAARPGMAALRTRVDRAMGGAEARTPAAVEASAQATIGDALAADEAAAAVAAERLRGTVLTLSRSGTVLAALRRAAPDAVVVAVSRPGGEGVGVAETLAEGGLDVTLVPDAAVAHRLATGAVDVVFVGADTVLPDGSVVNKVGTRGAALAAAREGVPLYAVAASDKVAQGATADLGSVDPASLYDGAADLAAASPLLDVTPADLLDAVVTEDGALSADAVATVAAEHRALSDWR